jgi:hypothetical protein
MQSCGYTGAISVAQVPELWKILQSVLAKSYISGQGYVEHREVLHSGFPGQKRMKKVF